MVFYRKDACARALFFVSSPTASGVQLRVPSETNSIWIFSTSILSFFTLLSRTRDRRLGSEIPLSTSVAFDRLTSFGSIRRRCTKALRKQPIGGIESSASKRTSENPGRPPFLSSLDRALPYRRHRVHSSKMHDFVSIDENGACRPRLAPQCLHSPSNNNNNHIDKKAAAEISCSAARASMRGTRSRRAHSSPCGTKFRHALRMRSHEM